MLTRAKNGEGSVPDPIVAVIFPENSPSLVQTVQSVTLGCLGGAVVERWTHDRKVAGSTPGRSAIKSTRSTQPSIPLGQENRVPACMAGVRRGAFNCVGWKVTLCDPIWQVTSRSSEMEYFH